MKTQRNRLLIASMASMLFLLLLATLPQGASADDSMARAQLRDPSNNPIGVVKLTEEDGKVLIRANITNLDPGFHGFHVHTMGACAGDFTSAGGHYNPGSTTHGSHAGDLPSILVNSDRTGQLTFKTDRFTVAELLASDGSAFIVHGNSDNFANVPATAVISGATMPRYHSHTAEVFGPDRATQATGDAGSRAACGVIEG